MKKLSLGKMATCMTLLFGLCVMPAGAASVADKVEQLGQMNHLSVDTIRLVKRNDFLNVQAIVINASNSTQQLYYRFRWLDDAGFTVGSEEGWKPVLLYGNQKKTLEGIAPMPSATDFRIELNSPENSGNGTTR